MSWQRFVFATDFHGDMHDPTAVKALLRFCDMWKPELRVFGGDLFDFRPLRKKADAEEKRQSMMQDYADGVGFLREFAPNVFLRGNHDERLWDLAQEDNGILSDYARKASQEIEAELHKMRCRMLPYDRRTGVYKVGHLKMLHGYAAGVHAARKHALVYGSCLFGHIHSIDHVTLERIERTMARSVGCLCALDMVYSRATMGSLRHAHGWAYGVVNSKTGDFHVWQAEKVGGQFMVAADIVRV